MKFGHNFCADIPELITRVSESQHLSKKTKEIMFSKLDDVYYNVSNNNLSIELERLLSVIDTCILESIDLIDTIIDTKGE